MRRYRIKKIMTYNELGDLVETKFIIQKSFLWFWWKDIEFVELIVCHGDIAQSYRTIKTFSTVGNAENALLKYNEIESRTYQYYEGHKIEIGVSDDIHNLYYCYKLKNRKYNVDKCEAYYFSQTFDDVKNHIKSKTLERKELISSEFNLK